MPERLSKLQILRLLSNRFEDVAFLTKEMILHIPHSAKDLKQIRKSIAASLSMAIKFAELEISYLDLEIESAKKAAGGVV